MAISDVIYILIIFPSTAYCSNMSKSTTRTGRKRKRDMSTGWIPTKRTLSDLSYSLSTDSPVKVYKFLEHIGSITRASFDQGLSYFLVKLEILKSLMIYYI